MVMILLNYAIHVASLLRCMYVATLKYTLYAKISICTV